MKRTEILHWLSAHQEVGYAMIRIYLGVALFIRGVIFLTEPSVITELAMERDVGWIVPYVTFAHLAGGLLMAIGLLTRIAALIQIPVLLGAVFLIHMEEGLLSTGQSLELSVLVLFLLVIIFLTGPGPFALDDRIQGRWAGRLKLAIPWVGRRYDRAYALIRMYLGLALFVRGCILIADSSAFVDLAENQNIGWLFTFALVHYIIIAHLIGGLMMGVGLLTRVAAFVQIPVLLGAVFIIHFQQGLAATGQSLELSVLVLFLLAVFFLFGSGVLSVDRHTFVEEAAPEFMPVGADGRSRARREERPIPQPVAAGPRQEAPEGAVATAARPVTATRTMPADGQLAPTAEPARRTTRSKRGVGMRAYLFSLIVALPFFLYRGFEILTEPSPGNTSMLIVAADWVLSYFLLPFFLTLTIVWLVSRLRLG